MGPCVRRSNHGSGLLEANLAGYARKPPEIGEGLAPGKAKPSRCLRKSGVGKPLPYIKSFIINSLWKFRNV